MSGTFIDPSKGPGIFVRRTEMSGIVAAVLKGRESDRDTPLGKDDCWIRNETGAAHAEFSVFKVGASIIGPDVDEDDYKLGDTMVEAEEVDEDDCPNIGISQDAVGNDEYLVTARLNGVTRARLTGPAGMNYATSQEGQYTLLASDSGPCVILYDPGPADEERIAIVRIGGGSTSSGGGGGTADVAYCGCATIPVDGKPDALWFVDPISGEEVIADKDGDLDEYNAPDGYYPCPAPPEPPPEDPEEEE